MGDVRHFPDVDEYVWLIETGELRGSWSSILGPFGGTAECLFETDPVDVAKQALDVWFHTAVPAEWDLEDTWVRASVWRLGRVVDGGLIVETPYDRKDPATYGRLLHANNIAPDVVEIRTPFQIQLISDKIGRQLRARKAT
jgi:hypothetical protein